MSTTQFELETPIMIGGKETKILNMRRPRALDFEAIDAIEGYNKRQVKLISNICGITDEEASSLDVFDYGRLLEILNNFFILKP